MKRIMYSLLAAGLMLSSCQKDSRTAAPISMDASLTDADYSFGKATLGSNKKNYNGLGDVLDADNTIKQVSNNRYRLKVKLKGIVAKGAAIAGKSFTDKVYAVTTTITGPKLEGVEQLKITLNSTGKNGETFEFAEFEYKGDLDYELLDVSNTYRIKGGDITLNGSSTIKIGESTITVDNGNFKPGNDFSIKEGSVISINQVKMETSFAILFSAAENECRFVDNGSYFLLPNGHTVEQDPTIKKVQFTKIDEGGVAVDNPVFTGANDPMSNVLGLLYTPPSYVDPANPDKMIQPEPIVLKPTFRNVNKGVVRFELGSMDDAAFFKRADFKADGPGWARLSFITE
jgi:hypothetical protein